MPARSIRSPDRFSAISPAHRIGELQVERSVQICAQRSGHVFQPSQPVDRTNQAGLGPAGKRFPGECWRRRLRPAKPGEWLNLPERTIGFGVSTKPLREALIIPAEEEIVEWSSGRGRPRRANSHRRDGGAVRGDRLARSCRREARLLPTAKAGDPCLPVRCEFENMSGFRQLDLFDDRPDLDRPSDVASAKPISPNACPMMT